MNEEKSFKSQSVLLHICCGVCASSVIEQLRKQGYEVIGFFYNPNIYPYEEYKKRFEVAKKVSQILNFNLIEGSYDLDTWMRLTQDYDKEPEGGKRCELCFRIRLEESYKITNNMNLSYFTTTLTVSPHKDASIINSIGAQIGGEKFLVRDFKKKDGFKNAIEFAKKHSFYRQNYCGCRFSMKDNMEDK